VALSYDYFSCTVDQVFHLLYPGKTQHGTGLAVLK